MNVCCLIRGVGPIHTEGVWLGAVASWTALITMDTFFKGFCDAIRVQG